ncbi:hypothetical protein BS47DRAFT_1370032 [Hydnum rufescens UP504]|uniref:Uncharacterized protein n=1 Tax=Hydnum rufescens UP504 TaxID=1448309 RepID=A0A9P6DL57_9AGAM|nr:hypothetical protein BS47DRAFT_1370032 [Hydnum rufescens UP504]
MFAKFAPGTLFDPSLTKYNFDFDKQIHFDMNGLNPNEGTNLLDFVNPAGSRLERQVQMTTPIDAGVWSYEILAWFGDPNENPRAPSVEKNRQPHPLQWVWQYKVQMSHPNVRSHPAVSSNPRTRQNRNETQHPITHEHTNKRRATHARSHRVNEGATHPPQYKGQMKAHTPAAATREPTQPRRHANTRTGGPHKGANEGLHTRCGNARTHAAMKACKHMNWARVKGQTKAHIPAAADAQVTKKARNALKNGSARTCASLEEIEGAVVWNSMSALSHSKMMAKTATDMSEKNFQYELFGFVTNREVLDGQVTANAYIFLSSKATARILDKHIWKTPGDDDKPPTLEMWEEYSKTLAAASKTQQAGLNEVRAAVSAKMMHHLRSVFEQQGAEVQLSWGFPWNNLANFIYTNRPSFTICNWPSTVPYSWVGEMNSRQAWLLLQSLIVGFIYEKKNSNERILKPNSRIVFKPFNPSNEDCKSPNFQNVMLISDEKGRPVM